MVVGMLFLLMLGVASERHDLQTIICESKVDRYVSRHNETHVRNQSPIWLKALVPAKKKRSFLATDRTDGWLSKDNRTVMRLTKCCFDNWGRGPPEGHV